MGLQDSRDLTNRLRDAMAAHSRHPRRDSLKEAIADLRKRGLILTADAARVKPAAERISMRELMEDLMSGDYEDHVLRTH